MMTWTEAVQAESGPHDGVLVLMDKTGDNRITWSRSSPNEVEVARKAFNEGRSRGLAAFRVKGEKGEKGEQIESFDPQAERIILSAPLGGGSN